MNLSNNDIKAHLQREAIRAGYAAPPTKAPSDDVSLLWLYGGGYRNMPVQVPTDAQSTQKAVIETAYKEFGKLAGLSKAGTAEFAAERLKQNGEQVFKRGETPIVYSDEEFAKIAGTGSFAIYATDDDIAQLKALKTLEENAAMRNAPMLVPEAGITPEQAMATWEAAQPYLAEAGKTVVGAANAYMEDQFMITPEFYEKWGLSAPDANSQNAAGRAAGHTISAVQAAAEIAIGTGEVTGGTVLDLTGVGAIIGVPTQIIGVATITHGTFTGANTINNINNDPILNKKVEPTSSGKAEDKILPQKEEPNATTDYSPAMKDSPYNPAQVDNRNKKTYEVNTKHKAEQVGDVGAAPIDGQTALDNSVRFKLESSRRVGVDSKNAQFVVFDEHTPGNFHGHVRTWNELRPEMQNVLKSEGLVDARGNIISK